jgi:hypothetical protein
VPRAFSAVAVRSALAQDSREAWLLLLEIRHPTLSTPIYVVNNNENIISNGVTYQAYPFEIELAIDDSEHLPEVHLTFDNVERLLVEAIRAIDQPPDITLRLVLSTQPNVVEMQIAGLTMRQVTWDAFTVTGTLLVDDLMSTRYPGEVVSPASGYLGLFR